MNVYDLSMSIYDGCVSDSVLTALQVLYYISTLHSNTLEHQMKTGILSLESISSL